MKKRVVITGLGSISPLGNETNKLWTNLIEGKSGITYIDEFDTSNYKTKFAGIIRNFDIKDYISEKKINKFDPFIHYGIAAGIQAIEDSKINKLPKNKKKNIGVIIGSGIGGLTVIEKNLNILKKYGPKKISPLSIPGCLINMISGYLSIMYGFQGPNLSPATACATGLHAIILAVQTIMTSDVNIIIAGGSEKASTPLGLGGFSAMNALSRRNENPKSASRPWDVNRDGFVLGNGAACIVIEEYNHAIKRNANIYAEISGFGMSSDAFHITKPVNEGYGAFKAMKLAIDNAGILPEQIKYINAHGTSTIDGDINESIAIKKVLGNKHYKNTYVSSTKSMTGHLLGASGCLEVIITALSIKNKIAPATINLHNVDERCDLNHIKNKSKKMNIKYALSNSFGFGGTNASIVLKKYI